MKPDDARATDDAALVLASLIESKLGWGVTPVPKSVPAEIAALSYADLMNLIRHLASLAVSEGRARWKKFDVGETQLRASYVGQIILNWPHGLHQALSEALSRLADKRQFMLLGDIAKTTIGGFQRWASSPSAPECVRREVSQFFSVYRFSNAKNTIYLSPQADPGVVHAFMAPERAIETISHSEARHVLGISVGWLENFVKSGAIRKVPRLYAATNIASYDKRSVDALAPLLSSVVTAHEACKMLDINQNQLAKMKQSGVLPVAMGGRCNVTSGRYALEAINGLLGQFEQLVVTRSEAMGVTTVLSAYYRSAQNELKFGALVRAILEKRLRTYRLEHGTETGLGKYAVDVSEARAQGFHLPSCDKHAYGSRV